MVPSTPNSPVGLVPSWTSWSKSLVTPSQFAGGWEGETVQANKQSVCSQKLRAIRSLLTKLQVSELGGLWLQYLLAYSVCPDKTWHSKLITFWGHETRSKMGVGQKKTPKMNPGKWKHGLQPAVPWFNCDPHPNGEHRQNERTIRFERQLAMVQIPVSPSEHPIQSNH